MNEKKSLKNITNYELDEFIAGEDTVRFIVPEVGIGRNMWEKFPSPQENASEDTGWQNAWNKGAGETKENVDAKQWRGFEYECDQMMEDSVREESCKENWSSSRLVMSNTREEKDKR